MRYNAEVDVAHTLWGGPEAVRSTGAKNEDSGFEWSGRPDVGWNPRAKDLGMLERIDYAIWRAADSSVTMASAVTAIVTRLCQNPG
jgi:hypothetical protein